MDFKQKKRNESFLAKLEAEEDKDKYFIKSGNCDDMIKIINEKRKPTIRPDQLPF